MYLKKGKFYYGHTVNLSNYIDFKEGAGSPLAARVDVGEYSLTDFCNKVATALNGTGTLDYAVTVDRATRLITISASGPFTLLGATGANIGFGLFNLMGFLNVDTSSATSHVGDFASGSEWVPQFWPQSGVSFENQQIPIDGSVKQSTSGIVEAVRFGVKKVMEANFQYITNIGMPTGAPIDNDQQGIENARAFLEYVTTKADIEFMSDKDLPSTFVKCLLEKTPESQDGLGFRLKEMYSQGLTGMYETGIISFRQIE
jgi:hypothetical protein